jgi:hypothetical protein
MPDDIVMPAATSDAEEPATLGATARSVQQPDDTEPAMSPSIMKERFESQLEELLKAAPVRQQAETYSWWPAIPRRFRKRLIRENVLATFVRISPKLSSANNPALYQEAYYALLLYKTDAVAASNLASSLEFHATEKAPIRMVLEGAVYFLILYVVGWWLLSHMKIYTAISARSDFIAVGIAGVVGAIVSLAMRRDEYSEPGGKAATYFKYTGALLPLVGSVVGCVIYAALLSNIISVTFGEFKPGELKPDEPFSLHYMAGCMVIGFFSGFSERFASGLMGRVSGLADSDK